MVLCIIYVLPLLNEPSSTFYFLLNNEEIEVHGYYLTFISVTPSLHKGRNSGNSFLALFIICKQCHSFSWPVVSWRISRGGRSWKQLWPTAGTTTSRVHCELKKEHTGALQSKASWVVGISEKGFHGLKRRPLMEREGWAWGRQIPDSDDLWSQWYLSLLL